MRNKNKKEKGFGLVEIVVVGAIIAIAFVGIVAFLISSRGITFQATRNTEAVALAEEGVEAVRSMRDESWTSNIATLSFGTTYYLQLTMNKWTLTTTNPGPLDNLYTRTVVVENVSRDGNDNISSSGTNDPKTKKVTSSVTWQENQKTEDVTITTYITNFLGN